MLVYLDALLGQHQLHDVEELEEVQPVRLILWHKVANHHRKESSKAPHLCCCIMRVG